MSTPKALAAALPAVLMGAAWLAVRWESASERWLHAPCLLGSIAVAAAVTAAPPGGGAYAWLLMGFVIYAALALASRLALAFEVGFAVLALSGACMLGGDPTGGAVVLAAAPALIGLAVVTFGQRERLALYSQQDPLTGVGNYRGLRERLRYEVLRHERHRRSFTVMLLDLDRFKLVNDRYGHLEGDRLLRAVGRALRKVVRDQDTVARQGGDEFSTLLPETGDHGAAIVATKIEDALGEIVLAGAPVRASIGWAVYPADGRSVETLLAVADERQRAAKRSRRPGRSAAGDADPGERLAA